MSTEQNDEKKTYGRDQDGKPWAMLDGIQVELKPTMPRFALMGLAAAQAGHSQEKMVESSWRLVQALVADWGLFEHLMIEDDRRFDLLDQFLEDALESYDVEVGPTQESSDSSSSSNEIEPTSRVVSFSRGTVETVEETGTEDRTS